MIVAKFLLEQKADPDVCNKYVFCYVLSCRVSGIYFVEIFLVRNTLLFILL